MRLSAVKLLTFVLISCNLVLSAPGLQRMDSWMGRWEFSECWPSINDEVQNCVSYVLNIRQHTDRISITLDVDGYMTMRRISCEERGIGDGIQVMFAGVRPEDMSGEAYTKGEVLFELARRDSVVITRWKKLKPQVAANQGSGVHFKKVGP